MKWKEADLAEVFTEKLGGRVVSARDGHTTASYSIILAAECATLAGKLNAGLFEYSNFQEKLILKGADSPPRRISIPNTRDRIVLKALQLHVAANCPELKTELAQVKIRRLRQRLQQASAEVVLRMDIESFYPCVDHAVLRRQLACARLDDSVISLIMAAVQSPTVPKFGPNSTVHETRGVPQGLAISNILAELYLHEVDQLIEEWNGASYDRYVDDIVIICRRADAEPIKDKFQAKLAELKLSIHPFVEGSKSGHHERGDVFDFLGYSIRTRQDKPPVIVARESSVQRFERRLAKIFTEYAYARRRAIRRDNRFVLSWRLKLVVYGCIFEGQRKGWLHYFSECTTVSQAKNLDFVVAKLGKHHDVAFSLPTFVRAYWHIRKSQGNDPEIENYDQITRARASELLEKVYGVKVGELSRLDDDEVVARFQRRFRREVAELENDVGPVS